MPNIEMFNSIIEKIEALTVYHRLSDNTIIKALHSLAVVTVNKQDRVQKSHEFLCTLIENAESCGFNGNIYKKLTLKAFLDDENIFSLNSERGERLDNVSIMAFVNNDMNTLYYLLNVPVDLLFNTEENKLICEYIPIKPTKFAPYDEILNTPAEDLTKKIATYYKNFGCGHMAFYTMFRYDSKDQCLKGISNADIIHFDNIIGYAHQKEALINNTESFIKGYTANNVLLAGSRGTGKSSCVKATVTQYFNDGLRIIEISKEQILDLPVILNLIANRGIYFILFVDDLSFEDFEIEYKHMKSLLEGSAGARPKNVLFYATSNRRHIIQEKWSDKNANPDDGEIHTTDMVNEKLSLSDRFGLTLTFSKPTPAEYLAIVKALALTENIQLSDKELKDKAMTYEINNNGLSGRTAKQFVNSLVWQLNKP